MAGLLKVTRQCLFRQFFQVHTSSANNGLFDIFSKPMPRQEDFVTGYQKIIQDAKKVGADPFEVEDRDAPTKIAGSGTKSDPYIVPSRNTRRLVLVEPPNYHGGQLTGFWVTLESGGRCPYTAEYYKLDYNPTDEWGVDELDRFKH